MAKGIKEVLMKRDGLTEEEAEDRIEDARDKLHDLLAKGREDLAYEICADHFGLEPDYLDELI